MLRYVLIAIDLYFGVYIIISHRLKTRTLKLNSRLYRALNYIDFHDGVCDANTKVNENRISSVIFIFQKQNWMKKFYDCDADAGFYIPLSLLLFRFDTRKSHPCIYNFHDTKMTFRCVCVPLQSWRMPIMPNVMARGWVREWCGLWKSFLRSTANIVRNSIVVVVVAVDFFVPISIINTITRNFFLRIGNRFMYVFSFFLRCFVIIAVAAAAVDVEHHARVERWSIWVVKSIGCELCESCEEEEAYPICAFVE